MKKLSVLTVTRGRQALLLRKMEALSRQTLPAEAFELIVCLNGADDGLRAVLAGAAPPFVVKVVELAAPQSAAVARNACAREASGHTLYFSDDDCLPAAQALELHALEQQNAPCVAVGGIEFVFGEQRSLWAPSRVSYVNVNGANTSVPTLAFAEVGGFDETLGSYGGEDLLLGYRLLRSGVRLRALPQAVAVHVGPDPRCANDTSKARMAGQSAVRIARMHPEVAWRLGVHPLLLAGKRAVLAARLRRLWQAFGFAAYDYERAYLQGALEEASRG